MTLSTCARFFLLSLLSMLLLNAPPARAGFGPRPVMNAAQIDMALKRLNCVGTALYVAAHPDDENTAVLTWLKNVKGVRAVYLSMTRGDGGQNLIGDETGDLLGVIRTQELLAARRIDGAEQRFTRALDFGYSKGPDETLRFWGHDSLLVNVVRTLRTVQPDIVINRFPATGEGGHGHHTASALLSLEAFDAAGDPRRFPDQVAGLGVWRPTRLFWNWFNWSAPPDSAARASLVTVNVGDYEPLLGRSCSELAAESRSMHKSQGFGSPERRGSLPNYFKVVAGEPAGGDLFDGIDLSWNRIPGGGAVGSLLGQARREFEPRDPAASLPVLLRALEALRTLADATGKGHDLLLVRDKLADLEEVIRSCAGLWLEAVSDDYAYVPGDSLRLTATAVNRSTSRVTVTGVRTTLPGVGRTESRPAPANRPVSFDLRGVVPAGLDWTRTQPWWLREPSKPGAYVVHDPAAIGPPENGPVAEAIFDLTIDDTPLALAVPVEYRWTDRVRGELYRPVVTVPPVSVRLAESAYLFPDTRPRPVRVTLTGHDPGPAIARLRLPAGWTSAPGEAAVTLPGRGQPVNVIFQVTPAAAMIDGAIVAEATAGGRNWDREQVEIDYDHIPIQTLFRPARARAVRLDLRKRGQRVGYVMGPGDGVPAVLRQAGYDVTLLSDADLDTARLAGFDAIVVGIRAYNSREALKRQNRRLVDYVEQGGTLVAQYNTSDRTLYESFAPRPLKIGRDRITVEEAPLAFLDPGQPLLNEPNRMTAADFDGWIQERGLYFASEWDSTWTPVLSGNDPGEPERKGSLMVTHFGRGTFIYTGLAFFRQLPAGVPGAIRLFVNLVSAR